MTDTTLDRFVAAMTAADLDTVCALLAPDVEVHSPTLHRPFTGADTARRVMAGVLEVIDDLSYAEHLHGTATVGAVFTGRVGDRSLHGVDLLEVDDAGRITVLTIMVRPLSGLTALKDAMTASLQGARDT